MEKWSLLNVLVPALHVDPVHLCSMSESCIDSCDESGTCLREVDRKDPIWQSCGLAWVKVSIPSINVNVSLTSAIVHYHAVHAVSALNGAGRSKYIAAQAMYVCLYSLALYPRSTFSTSLFSSVFELVEREHNHNGGPNI
jgi:hypothetical protein